MSSQDVLPFPPTPSASTAGRTMQESTYVQRVQPRRLPEDAPNIVIVLIDDAGPGWPTTYGGEVRTDTLTRIHDQGIGFNRRQVEFNRFAERGADPASRARCRRSRPARAGSAGVLFPHPHFTAAVDVAGLHGAGLGVPVVELPGGGPGRDELVERLRLGGVGRGEEVVLVAVLLDRSKHVVRLLCYIGAL